MHTLGVDLSARPRRTAAVVVDWSAERAVVRTPLLRCGDEQLLHLLTALGAADRAGVDCPFGWPAAFVEAMSAHAGRSPRWPGRDAEGDDDLRALRYRRTDLFAARHAPRPPLSVSFDKLGAVAARWARLQALLAGRGRPVDRGGAGRIAEVYPAAARHQWGLPLGTVDELTAAAPWLEVPDEARRVCAASRDAYDALVCALVARAVGLRLTTAPGPEDAEAARVEGWIHIPAPGTLERLRPAGRAGAGPPG
ncbi:DUF429 domain-containing protein [Streptomyces sp. NPDC001388]|uniref:DUF429 domain-containing protein n=1 Tax=unclassified Streptomyces TaxID=2593676 RepID=UPI00367A275B